MKIIVTSQNNDKFNGIKRIFQNDEIIPVKTESYIGDKPFGSGVFIGALNRIDLNILRDENIKDDWDMIISLQSGFVEQNNKYYITDVCVILDKNGYRAANGPVVEIGDNIYKAVSMGLDLSCFEDKKIRSHSSSLISTISLGLLNRRKLSTIAVANALQSEYSNLDRFKIDFSNKIIFDNEKVKEVNNQCFDYICQSYLK